MKIMSLNVNDLGGLYHLEDFKKHERGYDEWDAIDKSKNMEKILAYIQQEAPDIVVLQEFELGTKYENIFLDKMQSIGFECVPMQKGTLRRPSVTIVFVKSDLPYESLKNPHKRNLRANVIKLKEVIIYGVHIPYNLDFWDELIAFYRQNKKEKLLIIGDLNVYESGTDRYKKLLELKEDGAVDAWVEMGYPPESPTYRNSRIDYAIISPLLRDDLADVTIDPRLQYKGITDHAALIVEMPLPK